MKKAKVLFISQEINPYLTETDISGISRKLPQGIQESGKEIRTFMPRFGCINERRNQLHEVIRLSGMNLIIDDSDHPLIIKVASIQAARMQVYFIDNEEYFQRKHVFRDAKKKFYKDNEDRMIFFCRGVLETVKKLGWNPDIIHCHGWMTSLVPLYIKTAYSDDPIFKDSKVVYSVYNNDIEENLEGALTKKILMEGIKTSDLSDYKDISNVGLNIAAMNWADAVVKGSENLPLAITQHMDSLDKPVLDHFSSENFVSAYSELYDGLLQPETVLAN
ncbi:MAG: glycogen/starch synthase [Bacteroidia bacterium]